MLNLAAAHLAAPLLALLFSYAVTAALVRLGHREESRLTDNDLSGPQKFHERPVPRVGGIGIATGLWAAAFVMWFQDRSNLGLPILLMLACGLPVLLVGLAEDLTKRVSPRRRLLGTAVSAALVIAVFGFYIQRTDLAGLDWLVGFTAVAMAITVFAVVGVANSVNLIDGFNGLASTCVAFMLLGLSAVAWVVGDHLVIAMALPAVAAILGFLVWNFPRGLIFLGDGGAYFLGFYLAELALLLLSRNPQVSPLFPLLLVMYPVFETVFSMYRRKVLKGRPMGQPDGSHLHSLIFRRFMRAGFASLGSEQRVRRNSMTSPYLWALSMTAVVPAVVFWDNSTMLMACIVGFGLIYVSVYWRIVRFRAPRWLLFVSLLHRRRRSTV